MFVCVCVSHSVPSQDDSQQKRPKQWALFPGLETDPKKQVETRGV